MAHLLRQASKQLKKSCIAQKYQKKLAIIKI